MSNLSAGELVNAKTILLILKIGSFGNTKQANMAGAVLSKEDPSKEPDKSLLRMSKQLLDSPKLYAIQKFDREISVRIRTLSFPSFFKGGIYLIPLGMVNTASEILNDAIERRKVLVETAAQMYPTRIAETTARLGVTASDADYPSVERFKASFYIEFNYASFETPTRLKAISEALFNQEVEKNRVHLASVAEECQQAMRAGLMQLVDHLSERITPGEDGKPKRLAHSTIGHLNDFLSTFDLRNVTDDAQLGEIVQKARAAMEGVDHKLLKNDDLVRQKVLDELNQLKTALDPLIVEKGNRAITFEDD